MAVAVSRAGMTVIIPQYQEWESTIVCCESLIRQHAELWSRRELQVIVVDDGSDAAVQRQTQARLPEGVEWRTQPHQGVTAAWNRGLRAAERECVVLLNNDAESLGPWLPVLQRGLREHPHALFGVEWRRERLLASLPQGAAGAWPEQILAGWCVAWQRSAAEAVGEFDETMSLYWSDTDWQVRWWQVHGKKEVAFRVLPSEVAGRLRHAGHVSTRRLPERRPLWRRDRQQFLQKWGSKSF